MWFDSHCHLHICEEDRPVADVIAEARSAGVTRMITVGIDRASNDRSVALADGSTVFAAVGIHPNSSTGWDDESARALERVAGIDGVVAVGETGLDFYRDYCPPEDQRRSFRSHIDLAKQMDKAMIIHTRESIDAALDLLDEVGPPGRFVFHCWSGTPDQLRRALAQGAYISFAGNVSFSSARDLRAIVVLVPEDRLLIETDSPYLTPVPHRGKRNSPAFVVHVGEAVAAALAVETEMIAGRTFQNASRLFGMA
jgi:TatD DNase family protein